MPLGKRGAKVQTILENQKPTIGTPVHAGSWTDAGIAKGSRVLRWKLINPTPMIFPH